MSGAVIYKIDPETGAYAGPEHALASPLEPGVFLVPANATDVEPTPPAPGKWPRWTGSGWVEVEDHRGEVWFDADGAPVPISTIGNPADDRLSKEPPAPPPPDEEDLLAHAAAARYAFEIGGADFHGLTIATDRETQSKLTSAVVLAGVDPAFSIPAWKLPDGSFETLDGATLVDMARTVAGHVQDAFTRERDVVEAIKAGEITTAEAVDARFA